ncbi:hypothetical protein [Cryptosporangium phraense]|uniref:Uncharacterized protein n=1 Tax=Cryptosporangium phraense TaxID=2593070 RepID=A0A545AX50_9ACTN|nr:hypothetical protein [Cryptosporangium phraense]TQS45900.1 hypothetical protein FL583_05205 [Cryptosporangium phraense]
MRDTMLTDANLGAHKQLAERAADATTAFSRGLQGYRWPSQTQPYIDALHQHLQLRAAAYRRVAAADTVDEYIAAAQQVPVTTTLTAKVRESLGLPEGTTVRGVNPQ